MHYDEKTKILYVVSDSDNVLLELSLDGRITKEWAFPGDAQEGLTWDESGLFLYRSGLRHRHFQAQGLRKHD